MSNWFARSSSNRDNSVLNTFQNDEEMDHASLESNDFMKQIDQRLHNWIIPKVDKSSIYEIELLDFRPNNVFKTFKQTLPIKNQNVHINLFSKDVIQSHRKKFKYFYVGLVQIAVKSLF